MVQREVEVGGTCLLPAGSAAGCVPAMALE